MFRILQQISDYLDYWNLDMGYLLSFNFKIGKQQGVERIQVGSKVLFEGIVRLGDICPAHKHPKADFEKIG